ILCRGYPAPTSTRADSGQQSSGHAVFAAHDEVKSNRRRTDAGDEREVAFYQNPERGQNGETERTKCKTEAGFNQAEQSPAKQADVEQQVGSRIDVRRQPNK